TGGMRMAITMLYRVDFYEGSIKAGNVVFSLDPSSVPFSFSVGDFVDPSGWTVNPLKPNQHYKITAIEHQITDPGGPQVQHNLAISVKAVAR
ncbi:MAG TPA: hypothetical protein VFS68_02530, partial [Candidatus Udaeobacter sp.]|nr:hypothetical protein [Candidatus Udaeobacter sp.]